MQTRIVMIRHQPPAPRGCAMKFTRGHDLDPQTRIDIVKDVWLHQGIYGKMTQIAHEYQISRTFLYGCPSQTDGFGRVSSWAIIWYNSLE
jgi:hypothetical protein